MKPKPESLTPSYDPAVHSYTGNVNVSLRTFGWPHETRVLATTRDLSQEFPFRLDYNGGDTLGIGVFSLTLQLLLVIKRCIARMVTSYCIPWKAQQFSHRVLERRSNTEAQP
jgi:hypothetical protein